METGEVYETSAATITLVAILVDSTKKHFSAWSCWLFYESMMFVLFIFPKVCGHKYAEIACNSM